ncbi:MAG: hypothetical protein ACKO4A_14705, partial [Gammaproteobacteria bacterium]
MERRDFLLAATAFGAAATAPVASAAATPSGRPAGSLSGTALQELLHLLVELQTEFLSGTYRIQTPGDLAEGQRLLLHLLNTAINFWLEADPERPVWTPYVTPARKLLGDNPDALYYFAPVREDRRYRIRGNLAGATFTSFTVEAGAAGGGVAGRSSAAIDDQHLRADADGNYEILVGGEKPASGNWLPLGPGAGQITTRHYYESRNCIVNQTAFNVPLTIEPLDPPPIGPAPGDAEIAARIATIGRFVRGMLQMSVAGGAGQGTRPDWFSVVPNVFNAPGQWLSETGYGNLHAHYCAAPFLLAPSEALLIEGEIPPCRFANVVLWNRYMQTFDYSRRPVSLNRSQMAFDDAGRYR